MKTPLLCPISKSGSKAADTNNITDIYLAVWSWNVCSVSPVCPCPQSGAAPPNVPSYWRLVPSPAMVPLGVVVLLVLCRCDLRWHICRLPLVLAARCLLLLVTLAFVLMFYFEPSSSSLSLVLGCSLPFSSLCDASPPPVFVFLFMSLSVISFMPGGACSARRWKVL